MNKLKDMLIKKKTVSKKNNRVLTGTGLSVGTDKETVRTAADAFAIGQDLTGNTLGAFDILDESADTKGVILAIRATYRAGATDVPDTICNKGRALTDTEGGSLDVDTPIAEEEESFCAGHAISCGGSLASAAGGVTVGASGARKELASLALRRGVEDARFTVGAADGKARLALGACSTSAAFEAATSASHAIAGTAILEEAIGTNVALGVALAGSSRPTG